MKKLLIIIGLGLIIILLYILTNKSENRPFNVVEIKTHNQIINEVHKTYYDTILNVAMNEKNISGQTIIINKLSEESKSQFNGELKAHIRYHNSKFYLFIDNLSRKEAIKVLSHEVIHIDQYLTGKLKYENNTTIWNGEVVSVGDYGDRPYEIDAFNRQTPLIHSVENVLWD